VTFVSSVVSRIVVESQSIPEPAASRPLAERLVSLDAYRGFVMIVLSLEGYLPAIAQRFPNSAIWQALGRQFGHVNWDGGVSGISFSRRLRLSSAWPFRFPNSRAAPREIVQVKLPSTLSIALSC
jgi:hypothetical protein